MPYSIIHQLCYSSHICGVSSIHETIFTGVPILRLPILGNQIAGVHKMTELQAGLWLSRPNIKVDTLGDALHRLLSPNSSLTKEVRESMQGLQRMIRIIDCDRERSADLIELAAIPNAIKAHESADWRMP